MRFIGTPCIYTYTYSYLHALNEKFSANKLQKMIYQDVEFQ